MTFRTTSAFELLQTLVKASSMIVLASAISPVPIIVERLGEGQFDDLDVLALLGEPPPAPVRVAAACRGRRRSAAAR